MPQGRRREKMPQGGGGGLVEASVICRKKVLWLRTGAIVVLSASTQSSVQDMPPTRKTPDANTYSLQLKVGKGLANVPIFRRDGWPSLAEWGLCTPIGMSTNKYHGDTEDMLRRQPPAYSVQTSCIDILLPHSPPYSMTASSHPT